jgi:hypothetical protein
MTLSGKMKQKKSKQIQLIEDDKLKQSTYEEVVLNKEVFVDTLNKILAYNDFNSLKRDVETLLNVITNTTEDKTGILSDNRDENYQNTISRRLDVFISELEQILESHTIKRAQYYLKRLEKGVSKTRTSAINDINLSRWKEYDNIETNSLWVLNKRDTSGAHLGWYWGNFIPQIPNQMMLRYTKRYDWVLDTFLGSGTTLIECRRLGRNGIGIELNSEVTRKARELIEQEPNDDNVVTDTITDDSRNVDIKEVLMKHNIKSVQLLIMHPPYHDIIKFSDDPRDLSNAESVTNFLQMFGDVVENATPFLDKGRYLALVIGDKYSKGEWIPLGFYCMNEVLKSGYSLKSIIVKNFEETRGKRNQKELWDYRALVGGFYIFKHEYIMLFKKL